MTFRGFDRIAGLECGQKVFSCKKCDNLCDVTEISTQDGKMYHGDRCGIYENAGEKKTQQETLFDRRDIEMMKYAQPPVEGQVNIGIPRVGMFYDMFPFWSTFFQGIGANLIPSDKTNKTIRNKGLEHANALAPELCFPFKVAFGHFATLDGKVDYIFAPDIVQGFGSKYSQSGVETPTGWEGSRACPYIQTFGSLVARNTVSTTPVINPMLNLREPAKLSVRELTEKFNSAGINVSKKKVASAFSDATSAYGQFVRDLRMMGQGALDSLESPEKGIVIVGRPYSIFDGAMNLELAGKVAKYGFVPIPMDMLPLPSRDLSEIWTNEFSIQGQKILNASEAIKENNLNAILVDYFGCGPNSFIKHFFSRQLGRPFLTLQLDEHSADAGMITRLEAFLDSISAGRKK